MTYSFSSINSLPIFEQKQLYKLQATGHQRYHRSTLVKNAPSKRSDSDWLSHRDMNFEICVLLLLVHWLMSIGWITGSICWTYGQHMSGRQNKLLTPCQKYRFSLFWGALSLYRFSTISCSNQHCKKCTGIGLRIQISKLPRMDWGALTVLAFATM